MQIKQKLNWRNYGRVNGSSEFRIALCDRYGVPLMYYRGYWNGKRGTYRCYPQKVVVPGSYKFEPFELSMFDVRRVDVK